MKRLIIFSTLILIISSCKKANEEITLSGSYVEASPFAGRTILTFLPNNLMVTTEVGSFSDTTVYAVFSDKILLRTRSGLYPPSELEFKQLDNNSFAIENIYPSIPEASRVMMVFKK